MVLVHHIHDIEKNYSTMDKQINIIHFVVVFTLCSLPKINEHRTYHEANTA